MSQQKPHDQSTESQLLLLTRYDKIEDPPMTSSLQVETQVIVITRPPINTILRSTQWKKKKKSNIHITHTRYNRHKILTRSRLVCTRSLHFFYSRAITNRRLNNYPRVHSKSKPQPSKFYYFVTLPNTKNRYILGQLIVKGDHLIFNLSP